jgi:hypothetical protein
MTLSDAGLQIKTATSFQDHQRVAQVADLAERALCAR